jgi:hypothetical protein
MRDRRGRTERTAERVRALADEPVPTDVRERHLHRIRTHEASHEAAHGAAAARAPSAAGPPRLHRRLAPLTAAATALVLFGGGGTVVAAQDAVPDDALYGVKRASEQVWTSLPRDAGRSAEVRLALAERRLGEARRAPEHAQRLISEGVEEAEAAAEERPESAIESLGRLLGEGEGRLPDQASPRARQALHRNCLRIAAKHGLSDAPCGDAPEVGDHPGRGPRGEAGPAAPGRQKDGAHPGRGWGPGGRPEGAVGPPPGVPGRGGDEDIDLDEDGDGEDGHEDGGDEG